MSIIFSIHDVSAGYGKKTVVSGLEFEVKSGEILTIIGANGAGKSTVLKTISAQLPVISGTVTADGKSIDSMNAKEIAKCISVCLTEKVTPERTTCRDIVSAGRYPYTGSLGILSESDRTVVREAMELTGTAHLSDTDIRFISDGQRQAVMLARAVAQQPKIMILDEPTSFLDISNKLKLLSILRELVRSKNIAVVQTLHELDLAQRFSDKILCINNGKAEKTGTPEEIFRGDYINRLYGISDGTFEPVYGTAEAKRVQGEPKVFVISGGGNGIPVYRRLQRQGIPFATGVIHENDIEYPAAKSLASEIVTEKAFEPISADSLEKAVSILKKCGKVICCAETFGTMNDGNRKLLETAEEYGMETVSEI